MTDEIIKVLHALATILLLLLAAQIKEAAIAHLTGDVHVVRVSR
jgi:hypothetical protein